MSGVRARRLVAALLCAGSTILAVHAAAAREDIAQTDESSKRQHLAAQRDQVEARHAARELECAERFAVTACLDESRAERRRSLADIKAQFAAIDSGERARRAAVRQRRIDAKMARRARALQPGASAPSPPLLLPVDAAVR